MSPRSVVRLLAGLLVLAASVLSAAPASAALAGRSLLPAPALVATPASGPVGSASTLGGRGFAANTSGSVSVGPAGAAKVYAVKTDGRGTFTLGVRIPAPAAGATSVPLTARVGTRSAQASFAVTASTAPPAPPRLRFGVATPGGPTATAELDAVTALAGEAPSVVLSYADFTRELDVTGLRAVAARGAVPLVTWEPWVAGAGVQQPAYALDRITSGDFDPYLRRWADGLRSYGGPVMLRFAHEMNGNWYPWSEGVNGNGAGDYAAAWRHVRSVFSAAGVTSAVQWVWSPNVPYPGSVPLAGLYPGADVVDVVALDGYNFGTSTAWSAWTAPDALFGPGLSALRTIAAGKPVVVAETASSELGGSKATWVTALITYLAAQPDVTGVVWFHFDKETDWRIDSSASAASALAAALAARRTT